LIIFFITWLIISKFRGNKQNILTEEEQLAVKISDMPPNLKPIRDWFVQDFDISAKSAICTEGEGVNYKVLFQENRNERLSIASLTKLMTALVVLENYDLNQVITISNDAVNQPGGQGFLKVGEMFTVKSLLYSALMESNNDAVYSLAETIGVGKFVDLMNSEAFKLGLEQTNFVEPTGMSPDNYSSVQDLVKLTRYLLESQPLIWEILSQKSFRVSTSDKNFHHEVLNTNELLEKIPNIIGGKTGQTDEAKGCLLLVLNNPKTQNNMICIILGSNDRFGEMEKLINWVNQAYRW